MDVARPGRWLWAIGLGAALAWPVLQSGGQEPGTKPAPEQLPPPKVLEGQTLPEVKAGEHPAKLVPLSLDTVLRLAQDQNGQVQIAREKLQEAYANADLAHKNWLPDLTVGPSYYRHEGGIQDENGRFIHSSFGAVFAGMEVRSRLDLHELAYQKVEAERKVWQQRGEVSKLTSDKLLEAATAYVELVTARSAEALSRELENRWEKLAKRAKDKADVDRGTTFLSEGVQAELIGQRYVTRRLRESAANAAARLIYLLGLDPCSELVILDSSLLPLGLIDANIPACDLVAKAWQDGPGIRDMEGLLGLIEDARAKAQGHSRFLPTIEATMAEGAFGAGPGGSTTWDNRWDMAVHARWDIRNLLVAKERSRIQHHRTQQAYLQYDDLRARLAAGVAEARETSLAAGELIEVGKSQITRAQETYRLTHERYTGNLAGSTPWEVLQTIRLLFSAQYNYLNALRDQNKAQISLLILLGAAAPDPHHDHAHHHP